MTAVCKKILTISLNPDTRALTSPITHHAVASFWLISSGSKYGNKLSLLLCSSNGFIRSYVRSQLGMSIAPPWSSKLVGQSRNGKNVPISGWNKASFDGSSHVGREQGRKWGRTLKGIPYRLWRRSHSRLAQR